MLIAATGGTAQLDGHRMTGAQKIERAICFEHCSSVMCLWVAKTRIKLLPTMSMRLTGMSKSSARWDEPHHYFYYYYHCHPGTATTTVTTLSLSLLHCFLCRVGVSRHCVPRSLQAIHAFHGELPCDLSFDAGAVIIILTRTSSQNDWWEGRLQGRVGIFPSNYVKVL